MYLKSNFFKSFVTAPEEPGHSESEILVEKLCNRVETSTSLEKRRDAVVLPLSKSSEM